MVYFTICKQNVVNIKILLKLALKSLITNINKTVEGILTMKPIDWSTREVILTRLEINVKAIFLEGPPMGIGLFPRL